MSLFILDLARVRAAEAHFDQLVERVTWWACAECLWLTLSSHPDMPCTRDPSDVVHYGGYGRRSLCNADAKLVALPDEVDAALWSAMRLGGVNAVVALVSTLQPEALGLASTLDKFRERRARSEDT